MSSYLELIDRTQSGAVFYAEQHMICTCSEFINGVCSNYPSESFDYISVGDFLDRYLKLTLFKEKAYKELIGELYRLLKPGGLLYISRTSRLFRYPQFDFYLGVATQTTGLGAGLPNYFNVEFNSWTGPGQAVGLRKAYVPLPPVFPDRVSIVIPTYNGEKFIRHTLRSLANQTHQDIEVVCVDDCSTDGTVEAIKEFSEIDSRFKLISNSRNLGSAARSINVALNEISGAFFAYSSQDDFFSEDWLEKMISRSRATGADAVIPDIVLLERDRDALNERKSGVWGDHSVQITGREAALLSLDWTIPGNALLRADLVKRIKYEEFSTNADEYSTRLFYLSCRSVAFCDGTFFYRMNNPEAITKRVSFRTFDFPIMHMRLANLLIEHGFDDDWVAKERRKANRMMKWLDRWLSENIAQLEAFDFEEIRGRRSAFAETKRAGHTFEFRYLEPFWTRAVRRVRRIHRSLMRSFSWSTSK